MKVLNLTSALCWLHLAAMAQAPQGEVRYQYRINMHRFASAQMQQYRHLIPEWMVQSVALCFNDSASLYYSEGAAKPSKRAKVEVRLSSKGPGGDATIYRNWQQNYTVVSRETGWYADTLLNFTWQLLPDSITIAGYPCKKAVTWINIAKSAQTTIKTNVTDEASLAGDTSSASVAVEAWYAPSIDVRTGPGNFGGLPGLVLKVDAGQGWFTYEPLEVRAVCSRAVAPPTSGPPLEKPARKYFVQ
jgi:GLPGLI family protein